MINSLKKELSMIPEDYYEQYMLYLKEHCESSPNVENIAGLFVRLLQDESQLENFLHKISKEIEKKELVMKVYDENYEKKLKDHYYKVEMAYMKKFLSENEQLFSELINQSNENIMIIMALQKSRGQIPELINNQNVLRTIFDSVKQRPEYPPFEEFEGWCEKFKKSSDNTSLLSKIEKEARKEAERSL